MKKSVIILFKKQNSDYIESHTNIRNDDITYDSESNIILKLLNEIEEESRRSNIIDILGETEVHHQIFENTNQSSSASHSTPYFLLLSERVRNNHKNNI